MKQFGLLTVIAFSFGLQAGTIRRDCLFLTSELANETSYVCDKSRVELDAFMDTYQTNTSDNKLEELYRLQGAVGLCGAQVSATCNTSSIEERTLDCDELVLNLSSEGLVNQIIEDEQARADNLTDLKDRCTSQISTL